MHNSTMLWLWINSFSRFTTPSSDTHADIQWKVTVKATAYFTHMSDVWVNFSPAGSKWITGKRFNVENIHHPHHTPPLLYFNLICSYIQVLTLHNVPKYSHTCSPRSWQIFIKLFSIPSPICHPSPSCLTTLLPFFSTSPPVFLSVSSVSLCYKWRVRNLRPSRLSFYWHFFVIYW